MLFGQWIALMALAASLLLLWSLKDVLLLVFTAVVLAVALVTLSQTIKRRTVLNHWLSLLVTLLVVALLLLLLTVVLVPPFASEYRQLIAQLPRALEALEELLRSSLGQLSSYVYGPGADPTAGLISLLGDDLEDLSPVRALGEGVNRLWGLAGNLGSGLVRLIFVAAVAVMIAAQPQAYRDVAVRLTPSFYRRRFRQILDDCGTALSNWLVGVLISSLCVALLAGVGLGLLGVKLVVANALLAGLLNVIPNIGPTLSTVFPMSVAFLDAPWKALAVLLLYVVIQNVESYLITPSVMQRQVKLLPALTLTTQLVFTVIFGPIGLLLAVPLAVVLQVVCRNLLIMDVLDRWRLKRFVS